VVFKQGIKVDPKKIKVVIEWPRPTTVACGGTLTPKLDFNVCWLSPSLVNTIIRNKAL